MVATASQVSVTFSRPMVPLSSLQTVPEAVRLTPATTGGWRWLDPSTLVFEAPGELPKATRYTVEIPAGLVAADGSLLREAVRWTFATSPPAVREVTSTYVPSATRPVIAIVFDQSVDPDAALPFLGLEVDGRQVGLQPATDEERGRWQVMSVFGAPPARTVLVRPVEPVRPTGDGDMVSARLHVAAGLASLEGPERTERDAVHVFEMRRGLRVIEHGCGRADACAPGVPLTIRFSQWLRPLPDTVSWVHIEPAVPGATFEVWGDHLVVLGATEPHTTYTVRLDSTIASWSDEELGSVAPLRFAVGAPSPAVWAPGGVLALVPRNSTSFLLLAEGADSVRVEVRAVSPTDWPAYARAAGIKSWCEPRVPEIPGRVLFQSVVPARPSRSGPAEAVVEVGEALDRAAGHLVLVAEPMPARVPQDTSSSGVCRVRADKGAALTWIQRDAIRLDVAEDADALTVRTLSPSGRPLPNILLELRASAAVQADTLRTVARAQTGVDGVAVLNAQYDVRLGDWLVIATSDRDTVLFAPLYRYSYHTDWSPGMRSHFLTDRPLYAPGDTVRFGGWVRRVAGAGLEPASPTAGAVLSYTVEDPRGATIAADTIPAEANGCLAWWFVLPPEVNAGTAYVQISLHDPAAAGLAWQRERLTFQIQEVRRPNFRVSLEMDPGPHFPGARIEAAVRARYFTGGGLPRSNVEWSIHSAPAQYVPPGATEYTFGRVRDAGQTSVDALTHRARTDDTGTHRLGIDLETVRPGVTMRLSVWTLVTDLDQQRRTTSRTVLVHPAAVYVGLRTASRFVRAGETLNVDLLVVDLDGRPVAGRPVALRTLRQQSGLEPAGLVTEEVEKARCAVESRAAPIRCRLGALPAGDYVIHATVDDAQGRRSESELAIRVAKETIPAAARMARDSVAVLPDRTTYEPGDTAVVLIETSLRRAEALLTVRRGGVLESHAMRVQTGTATVRLPVHDRHAPNVHLHVSAVAADGGGAHGSASVAVKVTRRTLDVVVEPRSAEVAPGAATAVVVAVRDAAGSPVAGADVILAGIDEALLALSRVPVRDPLADFYPQSRPAVWDRTLRAHAAPVAGRSARAGRGGTGAITGVILDGVTGQPLARAWVEIPGAGAGTWTRVDGSYRLDGVRPGDYELEARATNYVTAHRARVTVAPGRAVRAHFLLLTRAAILQGGRSGIRLHRFAGSELMVAASVNTFTAAVPDHDTGVAATGIALLPPPPSEGGVLLRSDFTPVAAFVTQARTGPDGRVEIPLTLPHSLTRYRLRAVVAAGERQFGAGEATLTARRPLMVRPMPPRFLNRGDRFMLPVLIENRSGAAREVEIAVRAVNAEIAEPAGRRVLIAPNDRAEVSFEAVAGAPGSARFQVVASAEVIDAADAVVPILLPTVTESFAVYGELDDAWPVAYPVRLPSGALPDHTHIELSFATTAVHGLRDALWFLITYFCEFPEIWASRILALSALRDAPSATAWPVAILDERIRADVMRLARLQLQNGGWSTWAARFDADPFVSVHAAHALARARAVGVKVPDRTLTDAVRWLEQLDSHAQQGATSISPTHRVFAPDYPLEARYAVQAYALDVRRQLGHDVSASAAALLREVGPAALSAEALAWLLPALAAQPAYAAETADVRRELSARVVRSAGTAAVVSPYVAGGHMLLHSPRRTDAVVLAALVETGTAPELVAPLARGLMAHRVHGCWSNTQENAFAVVALAHFLARAEATEPAFVARAWMGERLVADHPFYVRRDGRAELSVPADSLGPPGRELDVTIAREGAGRLYYRLGLRHAPAGPTPPVARGFEVTRTYEAVDDSADVRHDGDGTWRVRLGARVKVRLAVGAAGPRYHVALIDPLPAGFEAVNPALAGTDPAAHRFAHETTADRLPFFASHVNVRADRFEAFATLLQPGRRELTYLALATTTGDFAAAAPRAEEMYSPETFGRGAAERIVIETANGTPKR